MGCASVNYPDDCWNLTTPPPLEAYGDISGLGVLISFLGSAWFAVTLLFVKYVVVFDPNESPFEHEKSRTREVYTSSEDTIYEEVSRRSQRTSREADWWRPNPIDAMLLGWIQSFPWLRSLNKKFPNLEAVLDESLLGVCDIQVITGIGVLASGFFSLSCGLSAYHWRMIVSLAWFSSVIHLAGLVILRKLLRAHPWKRSIRFGLMFILLAGLVVALVPTGYFTWEEPGSVSSMADPAVCYLDARIADHIRQARSCDESSSPDCHGENLKLTTAFQTMVMSIILLAFGFVTRSAKVFRPFSNFANTRLRDPLSRHYQDVLARLLSSIEETGPRDDLSSPARRRTQHLEMIFFWPLLSLLFCFRLLIDCFTSMLAEVYWLVVAMAWGTRGVFKLRHDLQIGAGFSDGNNKTAQNNLYAVLDEENQWTFGQVLPVLLLMLPLFTTASIFASKATDKEPGPIYDSSHALRIVVEDSTILEPTGSRTQLSDSDTVIPDSTSTDTRAVLREGILAYESVPDTNLQLDGSTVYPFTAVNPVLAKKLTLGYMKQRTWIICSVLVELCLIIEYTYFIFRFTQGSSTKLDQSPAEVWLGVGGGSGVLWSMIMAVVYVCEFSIAIQLLIVSRLDGTLWIHIQYPICAGVGYFIGQASWSPSLLLRGSALPGAAQGFVNTVVIGAVVGGVYLFAGLTMECLIAMGRYELPRRRRASTGHV
ncbi:hypothetical protein F5Y05DRAFT_415693 [Hypoxylon sp. FL0543]|nr:hypothetical protein F5Y05DRAFT_415693 [Hypoxylon sp. FL0543]